MTPKAYAAAHRAQRVRDELSRSDTVTEAIYGAGFNSNGRFYATSSEMLGMTPTRFRAGGDGASIRFAVGECSLGSILVAATTRGVCAILLGDDPDALVRDLQDRFPKARLLGGDADFERLVAKVVGFVEAPRSGWICRSTCGAPPSSSVSGRPCGRSRSAPRPATPNRPADRGAEGGARGGAGLRVERARGRDSLPSRRAQRRCAFRLPLGRGAQARSARAGGRRMTAWPRCPLSFRPWRTPSMRCALDWQRLAAELDAHGCAESGACSRRGVPRQSRNLYPQDELFRSRL